MVGRYIVINCIFNGIYVILIKFLEIFYLNFILSITFFRNVHIFFFCSFLR